MSEERWIDRFAVALATAHSRRELLRRLGIGIALFELARSPGQALAGEVTCGGVRCKISGQICVDDVCACPRNTVACAGACREPSRFLQDSISCGTCGNRCPRDTNCVNGRCEGRGNPCASGQGLCFGVCEDFDTDPANCGRCGRDCGGRATCSAGVCVCQSGLSLCNGVCVNLAIDPSNCGECGVNCGSRATCESGKCVCRPGFTSCLGVCRNLQNDIFNCGRCGVTCRLGERCIDGKCCPDGHSVCDGVCRNLQSDASNCGQCGRQCEPNQICVAGVCRCGPRTIRCGQACCRRGLQQCCGGVCRNIRTDPVNCGRCGRACPDDQVCQDGACGCPADRPLRCNGVCRNGRNNITNCGACGRVCPAGTLCIRGRCIECASVAGERVCNPVPLVLSCECLRPEACNADTDCPDGELCRGGICIQCTVDADCPAGRSCSSQGRCSLGGECDLRCDPDELCIGGSCCRPVRGGPAFPNFHFDCVGDDNCPTDEGRPTSVCYGGFCYGCRTRE